MTSNSSNLRRSRFRALRNRSTAASSAQIARIDALSATGRTNWFVLLAYLAFALVTTLGVEDIDFYVDSRQTELPLVGVSIPTFSFFVFAPILGAALYAYLHLHIRKVTEALAEAPAGPQPLEERIKPWLLNDFVLRQRHHRTWRQWFREVIRREPAVASGLAIRRRPLDGLASLTVILLVWSLGPMVLTLMWWRTWPAHSLWLSLLCAACLMTSIYAGAISWTKMRQDLGRWRPYVTYIVTAAIVAFILPVTWLTTANSKGIGEWRIELPNDDGARLSRLERVEAWAEKIADAPEPSRSELARLRIWATLTDLAELDPPDLTAARLSVLPPGEADLDTARHRYRTAFCARHGMEAMVCDRTRSASYDPPPHVQQARDAWCRENRYPAEDGTTCVDAFAHLDADFRAEWSTHRTGVIAVLPKPDLSGRDLRRANLFQAELSGVDLSAARMEGTNLAEARIEGANLMQAQMDRANLLAARMERANLMGARLEGANLGYARLAEANLGYARLKGADLRGAHMVRADLRGARMEGADLNSAQMEGAYLRDAWLEGANLWGARLEGASLWAARLKGANLRGAQMEGADLTDARLEGANLVAANMEGAALWRARLEGADLRGVRLKNANLVAARLKGAYLRGANLQSAIWGRDALGASLAHGADFRGSSSLTQFHLSSLFGNARTLLPDTPDAETGKPLYIPSCWLEEPEGWHTLVDNLSRIGATEKELRDAFLCAPETIPQKTGTPWPLNEVPPWETDPNWRPEDRGPVEVASPHD